MPITTPDQGQALKRATLAALLEAARQYIPGAGPLWAGVETYRREVAQASRDLPSQAQDAIRAMADDLQRFLSQEVPRHEGSAVEVALAETFAILAQHGLSDEALVREASLNAERAARLTLDRARERLRLLEADTEELVRRLVGEYYHALLTHREALLRVGVPAFQALLARTEGLEQGLRELADLLRAPEREAWQALRPVEEPVPPEGPIQLAELKAANRLVAFTGEAHRRLRDELVAWAEGVAESPDRAGLCLIFGPGGAGKSRVGVETGRALTKRGWRACFLPPGACSAERARVWACPPCPTLLILDYAENRVTEVETLLQAVADAADRRQHPLALLFLLRPDPRDEGQPLHGLLRGAAGRSPTQTAFWHRVCAPALEGARRAPDLALDDRPTLFHKARETFRQRVEVAPQEEITYAAEELPQRPLAVILLALLAAHGHRVAESGDEQRIFSDVWDWERDKWRRYLRAHGLHRNWEAEAMNLIEAALVAGTLGRPFRSPEAVADFWEAHLPPRRVTPEGRTLAPRWLAQHLPTLFPVPAEEGAWHLAPIVPDPLADWVLAQRLARQPELVTWALPTPEEIVAAVAAAQSLAEAVGEGAPAGELEVPAELVAALEPLLRPLRVLEVLAHLDSVPEEGRAAAQRGREAVNEWLLNTCQALEKSEAWNFLQALDGMLPYPDRTLALRAVQEPLYRVMARLAPDDAERARALLMLGYALSALGRWEEALGATEEAVGIRRQLAQQNPQAFLPDLAMSLNNLGRDLSALGRREEALGATEEAVGLYRGLAEANPEAFLPDLAMSLNNLGRDLSALGRREEALEATEEAVEIRRQLAQQNPQAFLPDLAMSLNNLGSDLSALGRREEALEATKEAVGIRRQLAQQNPQAFLPDLAMSLNNLGKMLSDLGQWEEALEATEEAVEIRRRLAEANPEAFLPYLAGSLNNLGNAFSDLGRREEALEATQEAVGIRRQLAQQNPQAFLPDLAMSLNNLGNRLSDLGRREEALEATEEAVGLYRGLAEANPEAFLPDLAVSLNNLGDDLSALGRREEALEAYEEAVRTLAPFFLRLPAAFAGWMEIMVRNYVEACQALGREPDEELLGSLVR